MVLVHGTASSPARWAELINELENDPRFWENYEIWLFMYNTGNPIAYSAMLLRDALSQLVKVLDPDGKDTGLKRMVVIGHSQGGLLTKMTVIDSGMHLWPFTVPPEKLDIDVETRDLLVNALLIKPLPFVRRVIFIATPHRGSYQALGVLGRIGSWLVTLPGRFTKLSVDLVTLQSKGLLVGPMTGVPTSIDNMNPTNRFILGLSASPIADGVIAHSIVGVEGGGPPARWRRRSGKIFERAYRRRRIGEDRPFGAFDAGQSGNDSGSETHPDRARKQPALIQGQASFGNCRTR